MNRALGPPSDGAIWLCWCSQAGFAIGELRFKTSLILRGS
jgi:hypothetical protein